MPAMLMLVLMMSVVFGSRRLALACMSIVCTTTALHTHSGWYTVLAIIGWVMVYHTSPLEHFNKDDKFT